MKKFSKQKLRKEFTNLFLLKEMTNKTLLLSMVGLAVSLALLATVSIAWFAMNLETTSNGMKLTVDVTPNLVITRSEEDITALNINNIGSKFSITFEDDPTPVMTPVRMANEDDPADAVAHAALESPTAADTGLFYLVNPRHIDYSTGLKKNIAPGLEFETVEETDNDGSKYYKDYEMYIASTGKPLGPVTLKATIRCLEPELTGMLLEENLSSYTYQAATVLFYVVDEDDTYALQGSIAVVDQLAGVVNIELPGDYTVPLNSAPIHIVARVFFDGSLSRDVVIEDEPKNIAYINSETINTNDIELTITFTADDYTP